MWNDKRKYVQKKLAKARQEIYRPMVYCGSAFVPMKSKETIATCNDLLMLKSGDGERIPYLFIFQDERRSLESRMNIQALQDEVKTFEANPKATLLQKMKSKAATVLGTGDKFVEGTECSRCGNKDPHAGYFKCPSCSKEVCAKCFNQVRLRCHPCAANEITHRINKYKAPKEEQETPGASSSAAGSHQAESDTAKKEQEVGGQVADDDAGKKGSRKNGAE